MRYVKTWLLVCGIASLLCAGCVSLMEKTGQVLDGSAFAEKRTALYRTEKNAEPAMEIREMVNKAGERSVIVTLGQFPAMQLRGSSPAEKGEFYFTSLDYLGGSPQGWNEYRLDLYGQGILHLDETAARLSIPDSIEMVQISQGRIRRYDTRITGTEALTNLRNRHERILALAEWMNTREGSPAGASLKDFENHWKPILLPEMVARKYRPNGWQFDSDQWARAEDIRWNTSYTERVFPEVLREIRNSGTMLRDWEEAIDWLYITYKWDSINETLSRETVLGRRK